MEWYEIEVDGKHTVKFDELEFPTYSSSGAPALIDGNTMNVKRIGGILQQDNWAWLARSNVLQIIALGSAQTVCTYEFTELHGYENSCIKCVEELFHNNFKSLLLAVVLERYHIIGSATASYISVFSLETKSVLSTIELSLHITCARFVGPLACRRTLLQNFDGCLALGSEEGALILLGMNKPKIMVLACEEEDTFVPCQIVDYNLPLTEIHRHFRNCQKEGIHLGLQVEAFDSPCSIKSLLPLDISMGLAVGLEDGRLLCYDLAELQIYYVVQPPSGICNLVKMDYLEPLDDPRPCFYILALYDNGKNLYALLHTLMFEKRLIDEEAAHYFEIFRNGAISLQLPLEETNCIALTCQSIATAVHNEEDSKRLFAISWHSIIDEKNKLLLFDLNQWYKDEMPFAFEYNQQPNYLAGYMLSGCCNGLQTWLNSTTIHYFNSVQRYEEHFYPNALSFDCCLLHMNGSRRYNWEGVQNRIINILRSSSASIFLDPNVYFNKIIDTRLTPQFTELNVNFTYSRSAKYEVILSVALEHNCFNLLRDCAKCWRDGSFLGSETASTGLSSSTLTDWIWRRATNIKTRCNRICTGIFQYAGYTLDERERKELTCITRQLKLLGNLLEEVFKFSRRQIPEKVLANLEGKHKSIRMASDYHNVLIGFLDIGILPKASFYKNSIEGASYYPYNQLKEFYKTRRSFFGKISENYLVKKTGACRLLYIDALIEHECQSNVLQEYWLEDQGDGLYPPSTIEGILRVMLVPDMHYEHKCAILVYFLLDLNMVIEEEICMIVFKLSESLIKTVQSFWNLDRGHLVAAVDGFTSPVSTNEGYPQWLVELLIEALLSQRSTNMALRILQSQSYVISPSLKLRTLLANRLISEAFNYVRSKNDDTLLQFFFNSCLHNGQFGVICGLTLNEKEELILQDILKESKLCGAKSLHFVYLLQKSKYIEAVSYMNELAKSKGSHVSDRIVPLVDTPNLMLSAFNTAMGLVTHGLPDVYFKIKNKLKQKEFNNNSPVPFSCQLIKQNANNLLGGVYHSSVLSAHFATYYWGEMDDQRQDEPAQAMNRNNATFFRRPQMQSHTQGLRTQNNISYPQVYKPTNKRRYVESDLHEDSLLMDRGNPNKRKRHEVIRELNDITQSQRRSKETNITNCNFTAIEGDDDMLSSNEEAENFLKETLVTVKKTETTNVTEKQPLVEIHSILKPSKVELIDGSMEEEKNLRNNIPHLTFLVEEDKQKENTTTISVDSSEEFDDYFYSPLSSQQNSDQSFNESSKLDIVNSQTCLSGPQRRKPLARLSTESLEKCKTTDSSKTGPNQTDLTYATVPARLQIKSNEKLTSELSDIGILSPQVGSNDLLLHNRQNDLSHAAVTTNDKCELNNFASQETATNDVPISICDPNSEMLGCSKYSFTSESSISVKSSTTKTLASEVSSFKLAQTVRKGNTVVIPDNTTSSSSGSNTNNSKKFTAGQESETMETTLGMTTFDLSILDTTTTDQCQPSLATVTTGEEENVVKRKQRDIEGIAASPHEEDMDVAKSVCEAREMEVKALSPLIVEFEKLQQTGDKEFAKNEDYIILSSSSSSTSLPTYNKQDEELSQSLDQRSCKQVKKRFKDFNTKDIKEANTNEEELIDTYEYEENAIDYEYSEEEVPSTNGNDSNEYVDFIGDSSHSMSRKKPEKSEDGDSDDYIEVVEQSFEKCDASEHVSFSSVGEKGDKVLADQVSLSSESQEGIIACQSKPLKQKEIESNQLAQIFVSSRESQLSQSTFAAHEEEENTFAQEPMIIYYENDDQQLLHLNSSITTETIMPSGESMSSPSETDIQINEHMATSTLPTDDVVHPLLDFESMAEVVDVQILEHATTSTLGADSNVQELSEVDKVVALNPSNINRQKIDLLRSCQIVKAETVSETPEKSESMHAQSDGEIAQNSEIDGTEITKKEEAEIIKEKSSVVCEVEQKSKVEIEELAEVECVDKVSLEENKFAKNLECETESTGTGKSDAMVQCCSVSLASTQTYPTDISIATFSEFTISMKREVVSSKDVENQEDKVDVKTRITAIQRQIDNSATELSMSSSFKSYAGDSMENIEQAGESFIGCDDEGEAPSIEGIENSILKQVEKREEADESIKLPVTPRHLLRGSSEPPKEEENNTSNIRIPCSRAKRGISLPPQSQGKTTENEKGNVNSLHTKSLDNKNNEGIENLSEQNSSSYYNLLQPMAVKISESRQSNILVPILEDPPLVDAPSSRTRSRLRRSSINSDLDVNLTTSDHRIRSTSASSNTSELARTRKRARTGSVSSQTESISSTKSRDRRARNVMSTPEETDSMPGSPKQAGAKGSSEELKRQHTQSPLLKTARRRRAQSVVSLREEEIESTPKSRKSTGARSTSAEILLISESGLEHSSARRLTRNQLAVLEKSKKLAQIYKKGIQAEEKLRYTATQTPDKQFKKTGSNRSTASLQQESDDNESIISKRSTTSSVGRRRSRSALKKNEGIEDDQISVTSSIDSETRNTPYKLRSKDKSLSITPLKAISEH
ncbi:AT hook containing transcription factor 1 homolog isoform 1-T4 [Glossina fuscipes fuscipes]